MYKEKTRTLHLYEAPSIMVQKIYLEQVIANSGAEVPGGNITEDWENDNTVEGDFEL